MVPEEVHGGYSDAGPSNAGDVGLIPGQGTKIPHAVGQLNLLTATREPSGFRAHALQLEKPLIIYLLQASFSPCVMGSLLF